MAVRSIPTTAPIGSSPVAQPAPSGNATERYAVTFTGPNPPNSATFQAVVTAATPYNDVNE